MKNKELSQYTFLLLVVLVTIIFFGLIKEFLLAVFWAVVMVILFHSWYDRILVWVKDRKALAATLTLLSVVLVVIIPVFFISLSAVKEISILTEEIDRGEIDIKGSVERLLDNLPAPLQQKGLDVDSLQNSLQDWISNSFQNIASRALTFTQGFLGIFVQVAITLYLFFFFLRDGKFLIRQLIWILPMGDEREKKLFDRFESVARATVKGSLLIAMFQGFLGGLLFWILGIPGAVLWGSLMVVASLLPVGAVLVWGPIVAVLLLNGNYTDAIIITVVGSLFIGLVDNLMRPRLVGNDTKMPDYLILLSTLGGLTWFGLSGFVLGPIIAALLVTCWQMMGQDYGEKPRPDSIQMEE